MNEKEFASLIRKLEAFALKRPGDYRIRVALLAILGYAYIVLVFVALAFSFVLLLALACSGRLLLVVPSIALLRSSSVLLHSLVNFFTIKFPLSEGLELKREEVPRLFATIERLGKELRCPSPDRVFLTDAHDAAIVSLPRPGLLGPGKHYLLLGLPLLQSLAVEEFRAVLAHEFGHLAGAHGRFRGWIYRLRQTWSLLFERLSGEHVRGSPAFFEGFFRWYIPYFHAYSFVLARADEYEADRCSVSLVGREPSAAALIRTKVRGRWADGDFWAPLYQRVVSEAEPPTRPFTDLSRHLQAEIPLERAREFLKEALALPTALADTHPCLSDRLLAIGYDPVEADAFLAPVRENAATALLGKSLTSLTEQLNECWRAAAIFSWKEEHTRFQQALQRLEELDRRSDYRTLLIEEVWERVDLTVKLRGNEESLPLLRSLLHRNPSHVPANLLLGQILLARGEKAGIEYLARAMEKDRSLAVGACQIIADFFHELGEVTEADLYRERAEIHSRESRRDREERSLVRQNERFLPHALPEDTLFAFLRQLSTHPEIRAAYLVRKAVDTFPDIPFYVLGILRRRHFFEWDGHDRDGRLAGHLAKTLDCPGETLIVVVNHPSYRALERSLREVNNSSIYRAGS